MTVIETQGEILRRILRLFDPVIPDEHAEYRHSDVIRLTVGEDGLSSTMVDGSNTRQVDITAPEEAFESYMFSTERTIGTTHPEVDMATEGGRGDHTLKAAIGDERIAMTTTREDVNVQRTVTVRHSDPEDAGDKKDVPPPEEIGIQAHGTVPPEGFHEAVTLISEWADDAWLTADGGDIELEPYFGEDDEPPERVTDHAKMPDALEPFDAEERPDIGRDDSREITTEGSLFNLKLMSSITEAAVEAGMDRLYLRFGDTKPILMRFEDSETDISADYVLAPKFKDDESEKDK